MHTNRDNFPAREAFYAGQEQYALGHLTQATTLLRQSVLLFAEMDSPKTTYLFVPNLRVERATACETCADYLAEAGQYPEAANLYHEAVNVYQSLNNRTAEVARCAHKAVSAINALRAHPEDRLQLLIARHERQRQQLTLRDNTEEEQAHFLMEIGQICTRRERYPQAKESFEEALRLLLTVFPAPLSVLYLKGVCHHQLGNLALYRFRDSAEAEAHYSTALSDLELCEGLAEYDETVADMCRYALEDIRAYREGLSPTPSYHEERE